MFPQSGGAFACHDEGLVTVKDEPQPIIQAGQRHRPVVFIFEIFHAAPKRIGLMRLQQPGKFPDCTLGRLYGPALRQRIISKRDINCPSQIVGSFQRSPDLVAQRLVIPPETGIDRHVSLKYLWALKKSVHREQSAQRMPDKNSARLGSILALDFWDELLAQESKEVGAAPAGSKIRRLFSVGMFHGMRRREISSALRVQDCHNN